MFHTKTPFLVYTSGSIQTITYFSNENTIYLVAGQWEYFFAYFQKGVKNL